ncbi:peptidase E [Nocardioides marmotae]|uniref:Peptidase E n=1 Tax=Nocardioides marmotae TaxID=2663857 RepID=A0A6I3JEW4_9ACTN|nr:peptidase E [Nocardioides marmotae]MCR6033112.1 peptidase E [Gordonia jinghuaiqii]MBC9732613.1 peptidase E [Nocardioides marmotae]MTB83731.1 peptidase E [Nocardioides marmotae]MTB96764.1 peptidase E [Nocardioides marmotae]QKE03029.1 peptidase E [Nocardioides marmotae]
MTTTIMAMGGGGFSMEPDNPLLDDHLLSLATRRRGAGGLPRVCFVPTASGDSVDYQDRFREAFAGRAETSTLQLFRYDEIPGLPAGDLRSFVLSQDVVYVGGGSTANLLALWRLHGLDTILREAAEDGVVLAGISAGMNCWFEASVTDSFGPLAPLPDGLGLLPGSSCPHYDGETDRRPTYLDLVGTRRLPSGYAADDGCALVFRDGALAEAVSSRPEARAYRVHLSGDALDVEDALEAPDVAESPVEVRYLG